MGYDVDVSEKLYCFLLQRSGKESFLGELIALYDGFLPMLSLDNVTISQ